MNAVCGNYKEGEVDFVLIFENDEFHLERIANNFASKTRTTKRSISPSEPSAVRGTSIFSLLFFKIFVSCKNIKI